MPIRYNFLVYLTTLLVVPFASLLGAPFWESQYWHPVFGIESGVVISSDAGKSQTFPISDSSPEFYKYARKSNTQTEVIYGGFAGAEWQAPSRWNLLLDVNYMQSTPFSVKGTLTQGVDVASEDSYDYHYKIIVRQLLVESKFSYVNTTRFQPYAQVGIGASFNRAYSFSTTVPPSLAFTRDYKNNTTVGFTYAVGAGVDIEIIDCLRTGVSYYFTDFGKIALGSASIDGTSVSGTLRQHTFYANEVFAQLIFVF